MRNKKYSYVDKGQISPEQYQQLNLIQTMNIPLHFPSSSLGRYTDNLSIEMQQEDKQETDNAEIFCLFTHHPYRNCKSNGTGTH